MRCFWSFLSHFYMFFALFNINKLKWIIILWFYVSILNGPLSIVSKSTYPYFDLHLHQLRILADMLNPLSPGSRIHPLGVGSRSTKELMEVEMSRYRHYRYRLIWYRHIHPPILIELTFPNLNQIILFIFWFVGIQHYSTFNGKSCQIICFD